MVDQSREVEEDTRVVGGSKSELGIESGGERE